MTIFSKAPLPEHADRPQLRGLGCKDNLLAMSASFIESDKGMRPQGVRYDPILKPVPGKAVESPGDMRSILQEIKDTASSSTAWATISPAGSISEQTAPGSTS